MRDYDPQAPIAFIHVPKCGGTSMRAVLAAWFGDRFHRHYPDPATGAVPRVRKIRPGACLFGHFDKSRGLGVEDRYPQLQQFLTVLRDPFDAMVSRYYYVRQVGGDWKVRPPPLQMTLDEFLRSQEANMIKHLPYELTLDNHRGLLDAHFVHIGVTEHLRASLACMARKLGRAPPADIPTLNVTERPRDFDPELRAEFRARHPLAYAIYQFALENHDRLA